MAEKDTTRVGQSWQESTPRSGKTTVEYKGVQKILSDITKAIKCNPSAKNTLRQKYIEKGWLDEAAEATVDQLVEYALGRIQQDVEEYSVFVKILHSISGMNLILKRLSEIAPHRFISSGFQVHNMATVVEQLRATSVREERSIEGNHEAKSYAIQECFTKLHEVITPHINIIVDEARGYKLIQHKQMVKFTSTKYTRKEAARKFLKYIEKRTRLGDSIAFDTFLNILQLPQLNLAEAAKTIEITVQGEVWRRSQLEASGSERFKPELDSGVVNTTDTPDSEQLSTLHSEAYSEPAGVGSDLQSSLHVVDGASPHSLVLASMDMKERVKSSSNVRKPLESTDGNIPLQSTSSHEDTTTAEDEEREHPHSGLSYDVQPVSETTGQSQLKNGSEMVKESAAVYTCTETQVTKENDLLSENRELKEKCMELQKEVDHLLRVNNKLQKEVDHLQRVNNKLSEENRELKQQKKIRYSRSSVSTTV